MSEKMSEKCPENVQKMSGGAENAIFGHFLDKFCLFGPCFCLVTLSNACPLQPQKMHCKKNENWPFSGLFFDFRVILTWPRDKPGPVPGTDGTKWRFYCGIKQKTAGLSQARLLFVPNTVPPKMFMSIEVRNSTSSIHFPDLTGFHRLGPVRVWPAPSETHELKGFRARL